jgi:chaperonin cofactor prefoldin
MLDEPVLSAEEIQQLQSSRQQIAVRLKSLENDLEHGMPVQPLIDELRRADDTALHMLRKYGKQQAIRPRKR